MAIVYFLGLWLNNGMMHACMHADMSLLGTVISRWCYSVILPIHCYAIVFVDESIQHIHNYIHFQWGKNNSCQNFTRANVNLIWSRFRAKMTRNVDGADDHYENQNCEFNQNPLISQMHWKSNAMTMPSAWLENMTKISPQIASQPQMNTRENCIVFHRQTAMQRIWNSI